MEPAKKKLFDEHLPEFVKQVNPVELLPYLQCLSMSSREEVERCQNNYGKSIAMQKLHENIVRRPEGWDQLVNGLQKLDFGHLAILIDPDHVIPDKQEETSLTFDQMEPAKKKLFDEHLPEFVKQVDPVELLPYLQCLSSSSKKEVERCRNKYGKSTAMQKLHDNIVRRPEGWDQLVNGLRELDCGHIANLIDPDQQVTDKQGFLDSNVDKKIAEHKRVNIEFDMKEDLASAVGEGKAFAMRRLDQDLARRRKEISDTPVCTITVLAGKKSKAGTDANVSIVFYGKKKANFKKVTIQGENLKLGDQYALTTGIPFVVMSVEVSHDNTGESPDWFCESITILNQETGVDQVFPCRKWLSKTKGDGYIFRTIYEQQEITKEVLQDMCKKYGRKSTKVVNTCEDLRLKILSWSRSFKDVWATYIPAAPDDIVFVVFSEEGSDKNLPPSVQTFHIIHRTIDEYSQEDYETRKTESCLFSKSEEDDRKDLTDILKKNGSNLMDTHFNLNIMTVTPVKSKRFALGLHRVKRKPCIVFYVCIKGYIPIQEEELPPAIGRYKTDVREGAFIFYNGPEQYLKRLKMGCSIGINDLGGTLGAFVDLPDGNIGCITSAHALLTRDDLLQSDGRKHDNQSDQPTIYQPSPVLVPISKTNNPFGHISSVVYRKGEKWLTGVEAAVITITDANRIPDSGKFPKFDTGFTEENQLNYTSGEIFTSLPDDINNYMFYKYGAKTGLTSGEITSDGAIVRTTGSIEFRDKCELHNQIEISLVDSTPLAEPGDSGALVLLAPKSNPNDMRALGILTGGNTTYQVFYVTPIWEILRALNLPLKLKRFEGILRDDENGQERDTRKVDPYDIERHLNEKFENEIGNIKNEIKTVKNKIGEVEGKVDEVRSEMLTQTDLNGMFAQYFTPNNVSQNNDDGQSLNDAEDHS